jgi:hypothetical protein
MSKRIVKIVGHTSDSFGLELIINGKSVADYCGYVPDFFPGNHGGDDIMLDIDLDTGVILNWKKPSQSDLDNLIDESN